jgi:hypothetical protein
VFDDLDGPSGPQGAQPGPTGAGPRGAGAPLGQDEATRVGAPAASDLAAATPDLLEPADPTSGADPWPEPSFAANAGAFGAQPGAERRGFELGDDERTQVLLRDAIKAAEDSGDDDVTRQIFVGPPAVERTPAAPEAATAQAPEAPAARARESQRPPRAERGPMPFEQMAATPYGLVIAVVATILAVIIVALLFARGARPSTVHVVTLPPSPEVRVDGKPVKATESPFVIDQLEPEVEHLIEVRMAGFQTWSTRLTLEPGQSLALPLVTLVPSAALAPAPHAEPAAPRRVVAAEPAAPTAREPAPPAPDRRPSAPKPATESPRAARPVEREPERPRKGPEPLAAEAAGTLRINSRPWSTVTLDGRRVGNTPLLDLRVQAGTHVLELYNPDRKLKKKLTVRVRAGQTVTRVVELP